MDDLEMEPRSRRERPAKPPLSRAVIVEAALELTRREGLEAVTVRGVAALLDTGPASLYVYVSSRDELLARMLDAVLAQVPLHEPMPGADADAQLVQLFGALLHTLQRYPGIAQAALGSIPTGDGALAISERVLGLLRAAGVSDQAAAWACDALLLFTAATAVEHAIERRRTPTQPEHKAPGVDFKQVVHARLRSLPAARYPNLSSLADTMVTGDDEQRFAFAVRALVAGARAD